MDSPTPAEIKKYKEFRREECRRIASVSTPAKRAAVKANLEKANAARKQLGLKKTCKRGHRFTKTNTYLYDGRRYCRKCTKVRHQAAKD